MTIFLGALLSYLVSLGANETSSQLHKRREKKLQKALAKGEELRQSLASFRGLREEIARAAAELQKNRAVRGINQREKRLWELLTDCDFQNDLADWFMTGDIPEGCEVKARILSKMETALREAGAQDRQLEFLRSKYFEAIERQVYSSPLLAHWRHQLSLDFLRGQVADLKILAEEAAGKYSSEKQQQALDRYCETVLKKWDIIDLSNLPEGDIDIVTQKLLLRQLYIPLRITAESGPGPESVETELAALEQHRTSRRLWEAGRSGGAPDESPGPDQSELKPHSVGECLQSFQRLVILGDPGGGKSTLLRWMATAYLLKYRGDEAYSKFPDIGGLPDQAWVPVLIRCRDLGAPDLCRSFTDFVTEHFKKTELLPSDADVIRAVVLDRIARGEVLILVDGLDEISDPRVRMMFCQELERTAARYPLAPILVSSRVVGYRDMPYRMGGSFRHCLISDLTREDQDRFAGNWIQVTGRNQTKPELEERTKELIEALHSSDRIERLAGNPMLLTTLALVKRKVGKLPSRRTKLYAEAVQVLLNWNPKYHDVIDEEEAIPQLEYVAFEMCRRGVQSLTEDEILDLLDRVREEYKNIRAVRNHRPKEFLTRLEARSSIIIKSGGIFQETNPREKGVWEFRHLTFQEYLAARALIDGRYQGRDKSQSLAEQVAPLAGTIVMSKKGRRKEFEISESWREVLRMCVADCNYHDVDDTIRAILNPLPEEEKKMTGRPRAILAALCLADEPNVSAETAEYVLQAFQNFITKDDGKGIRITALDSAAVEISKSIWEPELLTKLANDYLCGHYEYRRRAGGVLAIMGFHRNQDKNVEEIFKYYVARISSEDRKEAVAAILTIMEFAFRKKAVLVPGLIDKLLEFLSRELPLCEAAVWALGWLNAGKFDKNRISLWSPNEKELSILLDTLLKINREEALTICFLILILGSTDNSKVVEPIIGFLDEQNFDILLASILALGRLRDSRAVDALVQIVSLKMAFAEHAAKSLGMIGDSKSLSYLRNLLKDENKELQKIGFSGLSFSRDENDRRLLSRDFDAESPCIYPSLQIDERIVEKAAEALMLDPSEIRSRYEALAQEFGLKLSWTS